MGNDARYAMVIGTASMRVAAPRSRGKKKKKKPGENPRRKNGQDGHDRGANVVSAPFTDMGFDVISGHCSRDARRNFAICSGQKCRRCRCLSPVCSRAQDADPRTDQPAERSPVAAISQDFRRRRYARQDTNFCATRRVLRRIMDRAANIVMCCRYFELAGA